METVYKNVDTTFINNVKAADLNKDIKIKTSSGKINLNPTLYMGEKETASMFVLGMGVHTVQDETAHGNLTNASEHIKANDNPDYNVNSKGKLYRAGDDEEHTRYNQMVSDTKDYVHRFIYGDDTNDSTGYASYLFTPYSKK